MMSPRDRFESRSAGWRGIALAGATASLVTLVLTGVVALTWVVARGPASSPAATAQVPSTPTPRTIAFADAEPSPTAAPAQPTATSIIATEPPQAGAAELVLVATPDLRVLSIGDSRSPAATEEIFEASTREEFVDLASGSWTASSALLVNEGSHAQSERWLTVAPVISENFAVEAELRVTGTLDSVCDQSFGIAAGSPGSALVFGAGVIYPCGGSEPVARLTNVTVWEDGYNADEPLADQSFAPVGEWQTYRFELRDESLRLLVDGERLLDVESDTGIGGVTDLEAGLWSQGVGLEVRRFAVYSLAG